jgi:hypothetical protein
MLPKASYKKFVSQFSLAEWKVLCKHRLFLHFLKTNIKVAASLAADALQRPIRYSFPLEETGPKKARKLKTRSSLRGSSSKWNHRRFRL